MQARYFIKSKKEEVWEYLTSFSLSLFATTCLNFNIFFKAEYGKYNIYTYII